MDTPNLEIGAMNIVELIVHIATHHGHFGLGLNLSTIITIAIIIIADEGPPQAEMSMMC